LTIFLNAGVPGWRACGGAEARVEVSVAKVFFGTANIGSGEAFRAATDIKRT
jgi:hypothetical protein